MDTEQDMNREIKMSGEKMKEENMMTDKKAKRQNPAANNICTSMHRVSILGRFVEMMMRAVNEDD